MVIGAVGPWLLKELPALRILDQKKVNEDKKGRADDVSADSDDVLCVQNRRGA